jgi:ribonuclease D
LIGAGSPCDFPCAYGTFNSAQDGLYWKEVIGEQKQLDQIVPTLERSAWIAIDTEADSLHAYPEKLCLLQISSPSGDYLVDTLANLDLGPLLSTLRTHQLILHGADYDLRLLRKTFNFIPEKIFDTMIAGRLLGYEQFGLQALVQRHLGITLEKGPQKMNWARRPLTTRMEEYARSDTRYLKQLADALQKELEEKGRLLWHKESCEQLIKDCADLPTVNVDNQWRIKGSDRLDPRGLAVLRELWKWREKEARAANKPPFFVLNHDLMLSLAHQAEKIENIETLLPPKLSSRRKEAILNAIAHGKCLPSEQLPKKRIHSIYQPTMEEQRRFNTLRNARDKRATDLQIDPTLIASRSTLVLLSQDWNTYKRDLMNWQLQLLEEGLAQEKKTTNSQTTPRERAA